MAISKEERILYAREYSKKRYSNRAQFNIDFESTHPDIVRKKNIIKELREKFSYPAIMSSTAKVWIEELEVQILLLKKGKSLCPD